MNFQLSAGKLRFSIVYLSYMVYTLHRKEKFFPLGNRKKESLHAARI